MSTPKKEKINFRDMTDRELDWEIAKRKGWTITEEFQSAVSTQPRNPDYSDPIVWRLRTPEGKVQETHGSSSKGSEFTFVPGYTSNLRTAFGLLEEIEAGEGMQFYANMTYWMHVWHNHMRINALHWLNMVEKRNLDISYKEFVTKYYPEDLPLYEKGGLLKWEDYESEG